MGVCNPGLDQNRLRPEGHRFSKSEFETLKSLEPGKRNDLLSSVNLLGENGKKFEKEVKKFEEELESLEGMAPDIFLGNNMASRTGEICKVGAS